MWVVRRLKTLGASEKELLSVLRAQVLSVLQFATPAWSTLITQKESAPIESVLKTGLYLVYGQKYETFSWAGVATRSQQPRFKPIPYRTQAFARSAIPQMVKLANSPEVVATKNTFSTEIWSII